MVKNPPKRKILSQVAWPLEALYDENNFFCGFIMPRLNGTVTLQAFYEYPQTKYPDMKVKYKVIVAQNICVVLSELHAAGYVFGDFNPANIGVNPKTGEVAFYDMDTCHFSDPHTGHTYRCMGGCDGYVAPELLAKVRRENKSYRDASLPTFTENTDNFSLAIHIFKLLMNGITPYVDGYRFDQVMVHPPSLPHKDTLSAEIHGLLSKACNSQGRLRPWLLHALDNKPCNSQGRKRPTAEDWYHALLYFEKNLVNCRKNPAHDYRAAFTHCPYCEADRRYQNILQRCGFSGNQNTPQPRVTQQIITPIVSKSNNYSTGGYNGKYKNFNGKRIPKWLICALLAIALMKGIVLQQQEKAVETITSVYVTQPEDVYVEESDKQESVLENVTKERQPLPILISSNAFSGTLNSYDEIDTFFYRSYAEGMYYFDCDISDENNGYYIYIWTEDGERVASEFYRDGVMAELEAWTRYYIEVRAGTVRDTFSYSVQIDIPQFVKMDEGGC